MFWTILLGTATGMRCMTPIAVVCWAAYLGYLPVEGTWAFWTAKLASVIIFTLFALGEYVGDTLPKTPNRTAPGPLISRMVFASLVGTIIATALGQPKVGGILIGIVGALIGAYGGFYARRAGSRAVGRDLPVALLESAVAVGFAAMAVAHIHREILIFADKALLEFGR